MRIYEVSVAVTDFILFLESGFFAWLLFRQGGRRLGIFLFSFLGISSFSGAVFHAFFPLKAESPGGFVVWIFTTAAIGLVAVTVLHIVGRLSGSNAASKIMRIATPVFFACYMYALLFIDYGYLMVIRFYGPVILLLGAVAAVKYSTSRKAVLLYLLAGIGLSVIAGVVQSLHVDIGIPYLDYNTLYHIIQGIGLVFLYLFFRKYPLSL